MEKMHQRNRRPQAMTEYVLIAVFCLVGLASVFGVFMDHCGEFVLNITRFISLPFP